MNTKKSKWAQVKKAISIPALLIAFGLFAEKTYARPIEKIIQETQEKISGNDFNPAVRTQENNSPEATKYDRPAAPEISEELTENTTEEKKIRDTIRPQEGKSTNLNQETVSNSTNDPTQLPEFPGGMNELRNKVAKLFDPSKLEAEKPKSLSRADILYTVNEAGNVVNIKVAGNNESFNNEALTAFKKANENVIWKPAEKDGRPVSFAMRLPLTMSFE